MRSRGLSSVLFVVAALLRAGPVAAECDRVIVTADPDYPPLHWDMGHGLTGASIDAASQVLTDLGVPYEVRNVGPFARVLQAAQAGEVDLITSLKITPEREAYLAYTAHPISSNPVAVFVRKKAPFPYATWDDLRGKQGSAVRGNRFGGGFDEFAAANLAIEETNRLEQDFKMLELGRVDYVVTGLLTGQTFLAEHHLERQFIALHPYITDVKNFTGFVRASPCMKFFSDYDRRLGELGAGGLLDTILQRNLNRWRQQVRDGQDGGSVRSP